MHMYFFKCKSHMQIWAQLQILMGINVAAIKWCDIVAEIAQKPNENSIWSMVRGLCFAAIVSFISQEINFRFFKDESRD